MDQAADLNLFSLAFLPWFLFAVAGAFSLYAFVSYYQRTVLGALVRALDAANALSPETAKSFEDLDFKPSFRVLSSLRGGALSRAITGIRRGGDTLYLYLAPEHIDRTRAQFCTHVGSILSPILITLFSFLLAALAYFVIPRLIVFPA